jgi:hypothetical protein
MDNISPPPKALFSSDSVAKEATAAIRCPDIQIRVGIHICHLRSLNTPVCPVIFILKNA